MQAQPQPQLALLLPVVGREAPAARAGDRSIAPLPARSAPVAWRGVGGTFTVPNGARLAAACLYVSCSFNDHLFFKCLRLVMQPVGLVVAFCPVF